jgi:hypothetical protein
MDTDLQSVVAAFAELTDTTPRADRFHIRSATDRTGVVGVDRGA